MAHHCSTDHCGRKGRQSLRVFAICLGTPSRLDGTGSAPSGGNPKFRQQPLRQNYIRNYEDN